MKQERNRRGVDFEIIETPRKFFDLGKRRTEKMLAWQSDRVTLADLLANAYLQGIADATEAFDGQASLGTILRKTNATILR